MERIARHGDFCAVVAVFDLVAALNAADDAARAVARGYCTDIVAAGYCNIIAARAQMTYNAARGAVACGNAAFVDAAGDL